MQKQQRSTQHFTFVAKVKPFPDDPAATRSADDYRRFLGDNMVESFYQFEGYPGVTVEEIKKAVRVRNAFSNMLDEMQ